MLQTSPVAAHARSGPIVVGSHTDRLPDLAPMIHRQRLVIEGRPPHPIDDVTISRYLVELGELCDMTVLTDPVTHRSDAYGWAGWVHWETSGAHFYAWEQPTRFFSVDIYTCKPFDPHEAVAFTGAYFSADEIIGREVLMDTTTTGQVDLDLSRDQDLDLDVEARMAALTADLIAKGGRSDTPFGLYVVPSADPAAELARAVERDVFFEYFGNTPEMLAAEYDPYDEASIHLCVIDHRRSRPAGAMRLILPSPAGLKTTVDLESAWAQPVSDVLARTGLELPRERVWDIATIAVTPDYRGASTNGLISLALYQGVIQLARHRDVRWVLAILDLVVLDLIQQGTGRPFSTFDGVEPMNYLDSPSSLPVWCDLDDYDRRLAITDPGMHEILFRSRGLEATVSIPSWGGGLPTGTSGDRDLAATA